MTSTGKPETTPGSGQNERDIAEYLRAHPAFLDQHPELLSELSIPHASGDAVSLLERQITLLRDDSARLKEQLDRLMKTARQNETLNSKIHGLVLTLMNAVGPQAIFERLEHCLREDFTADHVAARVFADPAFIDSGDVPQFVGVGAAARQPFDTVITTGTTACGVLSSAQHEVLFKDAAGTLSAVMMPLVATQWDGVLVIASNDEERYQAEMGTEFLTYLKDVVTLVIDPWVKRSREA